MSSTRGFSRSQRVADQIQRELAVLIQREVKDPRVGMVTVSGVKVSRDFAYADVYVTLMNADSVDAVESSIEALTHASGYLRTMLAKAIKLRTMPGLRFHYDETLKKGRRMSSLIDRAIASHQQHAEPENTQETASSEESPGNPAD